jgi:GrpB-like predicted nucleotidyltransferase (UPF0157 family)
MTALTSTIYLAPYDPDWPTQFSLHAKTIRDALAERVLLLEHVGSTSVPFLPAKPVIDMVLAVMNSADRMLTFRDWLRTHDDDRRLYEETKRSLAAQTWKETQDYANAKSEVVREILSRARNSLG